MKTQQVCGKCNIINGIVSGGIAGLVLAWIFLNKGMLATMGTIIGMPNPLSGFLFHFILDMVLGLLFAISFFKWTKTFYSCLLSGVAFGILWWIVGTLILLPLFLGYRPHWSYVAVPMLATELVFGLVLGLSYYFFKSGKYKLEEQ